MPLNRQPTFPGGCVFEIWIFTIALLLNACGSNDQKAEEKTVPDSNIHISAGCYQMIIKQDTAFMKLNIDGDIASGTLFYKPFEKDKSDGTFTGNIVKDTLIAWYKFNSEGLLSVRQIKMKAVKDGFAEGYGDIDQTHDTAFFKYPNTLTYEENNLFHKVTCP